MTVIEMNNGGGKQFFSYKQGYWYDKGIAEGSEKYSTKTFKDREGIEKELGGQFETAIGGMVTAIGIKNIDSKGKKFSVLEIDIDGSERLSMGSSSPAAHAVIECFANLDWDKQVVLLAWTDKAGYNKLSIKQDGKHVESSFLKFNKDEDGKYTVETMNGYPERVSKDATETQKTIAKAQKQEFLETHLLENIIPKVPTVESTDNPEDLD